MSKLTTIQLVHDLTLIPLEEGTLDRYYSETVKEVSDFFYDFSLLDVEAEQATFTLPDEAMTLRAVFYDARVLDKGDLKDLRAYSQQWRDLKKEPLVYLTQVETERTWRIAPTPRDASQPYIGFQPYGNNFPSYHVLALYTFHPEDAPDLFDLLIAHRILHREFSRESRYQDIEYAERCYVIYQLLLSLLTVNHTKIEIQKSA